MNRCACCGREPRVWRSQPGEVFVYIDCPNPRCHLRVGAVKLAVRGRTMHEATERWNAVEFPVGRAAQA